MRKKTENRKNNKKKKEKGVKKNLNGMEMRL